MQTRIDRPITKKHPYKRCPICHQLYTGKTCKKCATKAKQRKYKVNTSTKLYSRWKWRKCRKNVILHYMGYDIWLLGIGIWHLIEDENMTVHHIVEREENPDLIFRLDNLITVSRDSHAEIHSLYNKGGKYKEEAIERIKEGIKRFEDAVND